MTLFLDAEARAMEFPDSFEIPTFDVRYMVNVGDTVKLAFLVPHEHPARQRGCEAERMWVEVTELQGVCGLVGRLANQPAVLEGVLHQGDFVTFWARHILGVEEQNQRRPQ